MHPSRRVPYPEGVPIPLKNCMDKLSKEQRSRNMAAIRSKNTKPEIAIRSLLHSLGYRFRLHRKDLPGKPDIVLPRYRTVIFINGCFWHQHPGCRQATVPGSNVEFWQRKLQSNVARDIRNRELLQAAGWNVLVIWECEIPDILRKRHIPGLPLYGNNSVLIAPSSMENEQVLEAAEEETRHEY